MPSILPGYAYDIFISYRQKDNTYDGWVTEFVENLRKELEATFKGEVSIYFDANPTDGLQETHDVDESLRDKLKVLVFIPIISQTYCDPNCFAWKNEFLAFKGLAEKDQIGMKVKVAGGNVGSRILPVAIHDLDSDDRKLLEQELGPIRSVDFVFRSSGVNRSLRAKDDDLREEGVKQLLYRDQINKVANAVKGIINGIRQPGREPLPVTVPMASKVGRRARVVAFVGFLLALLAVGYFYLEAKSRKPISIAVLPFEDMSPGHDHEWFSDGLSEELINVLTRVPTLEVKARTSSFAFKGKKDETIQSMAEKLGVTHFLEGSVRQVGDRIRVTAQLIRASDEFHLWSETYDHTGGNAFDIHDEIANAVVKELTSTLFINAVPEINSQPIDPQAINFYLRGRYNTIHHNNDEAIRNYWSAIRIDSGYAKAWAGLAWAYTTMLPTDSLSGKGILNKREYFARRAIRLDPHDPDAMRAMMQTYLGRWKWEELEELSREALRYHPNNAEVILFASLISLLRGDIPAQLEAAKLAVRNDPLNYLYHAALAQTYMGTGDIDKAEASMRTALSLGRDVPGMMQGMAMIAYAEKDYARALAYLDSIDARVAEWVTWERFLPLYAMGRKEEAGRLLDSIKASYADKMPDVVANCYAYIGNCDSAFHYFDMAMKDSSEAVPWVDADSRIPAVVRKDPRYKILMDFPKIPGRKLRQPVR